jgi:hypothetical protein
MNEFDEFESLPTEFGDYLREIKAWDNNWRVREYLHEFKKLPVPGEIKDIFISNDEPPKDLWLFLDGYCLEAKNFLQTGLKDMEMTPLKREAEWVNFKKQNFGIVTESSTPNDPLPSKFQVSIKLENDRILALSAVNAPNCRHLLKIYRKYLAPLFPI